MVYNEKPEIISWIDYFKNDSDDSLLILHKYIRKIIKNFCKFSKDVINLFKDYKKKNSENEKKNELEINKILGLVTGFEKIFSEFETEINSQNNKLMNFAQKNKISLRNLIEILLQKDEELVFEEDDEDNINNNFVNENKLKKENENHFFRTLNPVKSVNLFHSGSDKKEFKSINEDSKTNNIIIRKSVKMETIKNSFSHR